MSRLAIGQVTYGQQSHSLNTIRNEPRFEHLSTNQGLSHNTVLCIYQDREGFMWFGTQDGLNKYDGYSFTVFAPDPADPGHTIGHSWVTDILEDQRNQLWVTTMGSGIYQINKQTGQVKGYRLANALTDPRNTCFSMAEDQNGLFWIGSAGGLTCFDPRTGQVMRYGAPSSSNPAIFTVCYRSGTLWVGCSTGMYGFNAQTRRYSPAGIAKAEVVAISPGQQLCLWASVAAKGLCKRQTGNGKTNWYSPPDSAWLSKQPLGKPLCQDASGLVWTALSDQSGLQKFDPKRNTWQTYRADPKRSGSLSSNQIYAIYPDRNSILWIGTDNGLDKLLPQGNTFRAIQPIVDERGVRLPQNRIRALCQDHMGTIWLSNESGVFYSYQRTTGRFSPQQTPYRIQSIYEDHQERLWLGANQTLLLWGRKTNQTNVYRCALDVQTIREAPDGRLWLNGQTGLAVFDPATKQFNYFAAGHPAASPGHKIITILPSRKKGIVWVATNDIGLIQLNTATNQATYYQPDANQYAGCINDKDIRSLYEDTSGILWIGTNQGGLNQFDPRTKTFMAFTKHDGLPSNHIVGIEPDQLGNLWLATNRGLCRFNPRTKACRLYDQRDGLQDNEFFEVSAANLSSGQLLFGGPNGFNSIDPAGIRANGQMPPVYITQFQVLNQPHPFGSQPLPLSYRENLLSFDFVALNYFRPEQNQYAYQLVGVDADWVFCGKRRFATYSNLAPGSYVFRVKAANNVGIWNERGAELRIVIHAPFWRTAWFIGLAALVLIGFLVGGVQYRVRQIRRDEAQKTAFNKRLAEVEMQALRAQMNPHFIFNSLNSINSFILDNEPEAASDYLSKFSKLIRLILQNSTAATLSLAAELEALRLYLALEALRFTHKFTFSIEVAEDVSVSLIEIPPLILQPYVENAIWHGLMHRKPGGHIAISLQIRNGQLVCTIEDNGIGRQKATQLKSKSATRTKSMGMQLTAHRLQVNQTLTGQKLTVSITDLLDAAGEAAGTRVTLSIPMD